MSIGTSLPYIDTEPNLSQREAASTLISRDITQSSKTTLHPSLSPLPKSYLTPTIQHLLTHISSGTLERGIDTSRYESLDPLAPDSAESEFRSALKSAYTNTTYLSSRAQNLELLESNGKNAWLISNAQLEDMVRRQDEEVNRAKGEIEVVNRNRKEEQEGRQGELTGLEESWKEAVGRIVESQLETERLRRSMKAGSAGS